eukprot:CAMPEP_0197715824 /NCGR_PEP_ID=MMETSP1434-20131217/916_1 /TAXON_ID=265543 /ORGANISM="Minutocellus polymorphus, Strain CCMP3303" /LENGTH=78 /DNA_ID=CAMNT_0043300061 /DNA_START=260 /DNA_END=493 /DNA_ORIENTATION=+
MSGLAVRASKSAMLPRVTLTMDVRAPKSWLTDRATDRTAARPMSLRYRMLAVTTVGDDLIVPAAGSDLDNAAAADTDE